MLNKLWTKVKPKFLFDEVQKGSAIIACWEAEAAIKHKTTNVGRIAIERQAMHFNSGAVA